MELYDVVKKLIGEIDPVGETNTDTKRLGNINVHIDLVFSLLGDLNYVASNHDRQEYSMQEIGKKAHSFLKTLPYEFQYLGGEEDICQT